MKTIIQAIVMILAVALCSGCATYVVRNYPADAPKGVYPATCSDVTGTVHYWQNRLSLFWSDAPSNPNVVEKLFFTLFAMVDLPISVVTDTVMLPVDLSTDKNSVREK